MLITVHPSRILRTLVVTALVLVVLSLLNRFTGAAAIFDVGDDTSVPSWFSSVLLLTCGCVLGLIAATKTSDIHFRHWAVLAITFLGMSIDDIARIHERLGDLPFLNTPFIRRGPIYYPWVLFGSAFVVVVGLAYVRFLAALPSKTRWLFVLSGGVFVSGALGLEMLSAYQHYALGAESIAYFLTFHIEELFEKVGSALFLYALLDYSSAHVPQMAEVRLVVAKE